MKIFFRDSFVYSGFSSNVAFLGRGLSLTLFLFSLTPSHVSIMFLLLKIYYYYFCDSPFLSRNSLANWFICIYKKQTNINRKTNEKQRKEKYLSVDFLFFFGILAGNILGLKYNVVRFNWAEVDWTIVYGEMELGKKINIWY